MTRVSIALALTIAALRGEAFAAEVTASLTATFAPKQPVGEDPFTVAILVSATAPLEGAQLTLDAGPAFQVSPSATLPIPNGARKEPLVFTLTPSTGAREHLLQARLTTSSGAPIAGEVFPFSYAPAVGLLEYFGFGALGVAVGYVLKLFLKVRDTIPVPPAGGLFGATASASAQSAAEARLGTWLARARNYYLVDFVLTLVIALIALCALARDGHPPDAARTEMATLVLGFGLGLLTPNDLINRIK